MKQVLSILLLFLCCFTGCQKEEVTDREYPRVKTKEVTQISKEGAIFNAELIFKGNHTIDEYGFVWDTKINVDYQYSEKIVFKGDIESGKFSAKITTTLKENTEYQVKAFVKSGKYFVYGQQVSFLSLGSGASSITGFYPESGLIFDTVYIYGKNFSNKGLNIVCFDTEIAPVIFSSDTMLIVTVPENLEKESALVTVSIHGKKSGASQLFQLLETTISGFYPEEGIFGDILTFHSKNIPYKINPQIVVKLNNIQVEIVDTGLNYFKCIIPDEITNYIITPTVTIGKKTFTFSKMFHLLPPVIASFNPTFSDHVGDEVTINGDNFSPVLLNNEVFFGNKKAVLSYGNMKQLHAIVPSELIQNSLISLTDSFPVSVKVAGQEATKEYFFHLNYRSTWTKVAEFPGKPRILPITSVVNGKVYMGFGSTRYANIYDFSPLLYDLWEYTPETDQWKRKTAFPFEDRALFTSFTINNKLYLFCGRNSSVNLNEVWEYNPELDQWSKKNDFPGGERTGAISFTINGRAFAGCGFNNDLVLNDFWEYDAVNDQWMKKGDIPVNPKIRTGDVLKGFNDNKYGYILVIRNFGMLWQYNPESDTWKIVDAGYFSKNLISGCGYDKGLYMGFSRDYMGGTTELYQYNYNTNAWTSFTFPGKKRYGTGIFATDDKVYIILGCADETGTTLDANLNEIWVFDSSK